MRKGNIFSKHLKDWLPNLFKEFKPSELQFTVTTPKSSNPTPQIQRQVLSTISNMFSVNWTERLISPILNICKWYLTNTNERCNFTTVECVAESIKTFLCCSFILTGWQCYTTVKQTEVFAWKHMQHYANNPFPVMCFASLCLRIVLHCLKKNHTWFKNAGCVKECHRCFCTSVWN